MSPAAKARLAERACEVAPLVICAVRDLDPDGVSELLAKRTPAELTALVVVLAAAINPEATRLESAWAWATPDEPNPRGRSLVRFDEVPDVWSWWTPTEQQQHRDVLEAELDRLDPRRKVHA